MKRILYTISISFLLINCDSPKSIKPRAKLTGKIEEDVKMLIPTGLLKADIMDQIRQNQRQTELTIRFKNGIKENYEWFLEYAKTIPKGEKMPYNEKFGLTKEEYSELTNFISNAEMISSGMETVFVENKNDTINFKSQGKLSPFNSLKIDLKNKTVLFEENKLLLTDTMNVTTDDNGLKSRWKGYIWRYEDPHELDFDDLKEVDNLNMKQYKFTIGRLEKNGKSYMSLKVRVVEAGEKTVDFELPVVFR